MKKILLVSVIVFVSGCFPGPNNTPDKSQCMYRCSKCGKHVLMLNSVLRSEPCPEGDRHDWQYNLR